LGTQTPPVTGRTMPVRRHMDSYISFLLGAATSFPFPGAPAHHPYYYHPGRPRKGQLLLQCRRSTIKSQGRANDMTSSKRLASGILAALLLSLCAAGFAKAPAPVQAENGMVVTAQHLASQVGLDVLEAGGNAVDAAVAVGYALAVTLPSAGNIGGGGFMLVHLEDGQDIFINFREKASLDATADMYLDEDGEVIPGASTGTYLGVGVPGTVMGLEHAREE